MGGVFFLLKMQLHKLGNGVHTRAQSKHMQTGGKLHFYIRAGYFPGGNLGQGCVLFTWHCPEVGQINSAQSFPQ